MKRSVMVVLVALVIVVAVVGAYLLLAYSTTPPGNRSPVASFTAIRDLMVVEVDASTAADPDGSIADYRWTWGDGASESTGLAPTATHAYETLGRYVIVLRVTDDDGAASEATHEVSVNTSTIDWVYYDIFNVPFGEWWDYRAAVYGDSPIGAECFNATSIANDVCQPNRDGVPDVASYPYTVWARFGLAGGGKHWVISAPYRMRATGVNVPGYTLAEPVFLPTLDLAEPVGERLEFDWTMQFLDTATADQLGDRGCGITSDDLDGFHVRSLITITMDLQQSRRMFNVDAADAAAARTWWEANIDPLCGRRGPVETGLWDWLQAMGGGPLPSQAGKYDIMNGYEWFLDQVYLDMGATVETDGTTRVTLDHAAWGTGNTLSRMFYWGPASYLESYLDSTKATGWNGMEPYGWFEEFAFTGSVQAEDFDFQLDAAVQYGVRHVALAGPNGVLDRVDDIPVWTWGPHLQDYLNEYLQHPWSELDRYPGAADPVATTGAPDYGQAFPRDFVPSRWDLSVGQTWHFQVPEGNVAFYDPNLTPLGADPGGGEFVKVLAALRLSRTMPDSYGRWDPATLTWDVVGPSATGGPAGSPGLDGAPGTPDDDYAEEPWGAIYLGAGPPAAALDGYYADAGSRAPIGEPFAFSGILVGARILAGGRSSGSPRLPVRLVGKPSAA